MISDTTKAKITQFACAMLAQLGANEHKGNWETWAPEDTEIIGEIRHHLDKLERALILRDHAAVAEHAADIGNFCMKAWEVYGS